MSAFVEVCDGCLSEIILFQRVETCLKLREKYFTGLLQLMSIFQHVQCR